MNGSLLAKGLPSKCSTRVITCGFSASCGRLFYARKRLTELLNAHGIAVAA
jgi:hypothetical protein